VISRENLKQIVMMGYLTDEMLDLLIAVTEMNQFEEKEIVFRQGDPADNFYFLLQGKILLEQRVSPTITVSLSAIKPGHAFGWSAMLDDETYTTEAICAERCQVLSILASKLKALCEENHSLGYILNQRLLRVIKKRYDIRTEQFINAIRHHPDISRLI
jgi:CRP/FNR family cyclic AMP-dependent transcriptional regulator